MIERTVHYLKDYQPPAFLIKTIHLHFELAEAITEVTSVLHIERNPAAKTKLSELVLNGEELALMAVDLDGKPLDKTQYHVNDISLTVFNVPDKFVLETKVKLKPQKNTHLEGLYKSRHNFCTQNEPEGFRRITYYLDRPDVMAQFTTTISADKTKYPMLLANGNLIESRDLGNNRRWVHWEDPSKKPCYLFALVAGDFDLIEDEFKTMSGRTIALKLYFEKGFKAQGQYALASLKAAMKWDEDTFGREYDLDIYMTVAVSDFNMGAMENKGLNIFNTKCILAEPKTATDADYANVLRVIGHEYFHNWTGNRITCRDWFQITLKEGLTVFREQLFCEDNLSRGVARIDQSNIVRLNQFPTDAGPLAHPIRPESYIEINNFYTPTVYMKGAEVIRMVHTLLGKTKFREGMDLYFSRYDGQAVTTDDFIQAMEEASQRHLTQFKRWYSQAGTPVLTINSEYDEHKKMFILHVKQSCPPTPGQPAKKPFHLPLAVGLVYEGEMQTEDNTQVLEITEPEQSFTFEKVAKKPVPSLLRKFSAPVTIDYQYSDEELAILWQHDADPYCRYDAGQLLVARTVLQSTQSATLIHQAYENLLTKTFNDLALQARLLILPSMKYLMNQTNQMDIQSPWETLKTIELSIAKKFEAQFKALYARYSTRSKYQFSAKLMAERSIKNICLSYLLVADEKTYATLAFEQFKQADNMTDVMGALNALNNTTAPERQQALDVFYQQWKHEPLVVDKWFILQAVATRKNTLAEVKKLVKHPAFNLCNPNNVYSLICAFGENEVCFHALDGSGYEFLADQVMALDAINPIVSARAILPLTRWRLVTDAQAKLMKQALARIAKTPKLSAEVYEVVSKSFG